MGAHKSYLENNELLFDRRMEVMKRQLINLLEERLRAKLIGPILESEEFERRLEDIKDIKQDPYTAAEQLLNESLS
jgi:putative protein kinase ArgK-like GTPase of G3E family